MIEKFKSILITGGPATGKTTIVNQLCDQLKCDGISINKLVADTTRGMRKGEVDGYDYNYIGISEYLSSYKEGLYVGNLRDNHYNNSYYGTPVTWLHESKSANSIGLPTCVSVAKKLINLFLESKSGQEVVWFHLNASNTIKKERLSSRTGLSQEIKIRLSRGDSHFYENQAVNIDTGKQSVEESILLIKKAII